MYDTKVLTGNGEDDKLVLMLKSLMVVGVVGVIAAGTVSAQVSVAPGDLKENRLQLKEAREDFKTEAQRLREARQAELKKKQEEYKAKLAEVKEQRKKVIVERFVKNMHELRKKRVEQLRAMLDRIRESLAKLEGVLAEAELVGKEVSVAEADMAAAKTAVQDAQIALDALVVRDFTPTLTGENSLGSDLSKLKNEYTFEVKAVLDKVQVAKRAVNRVLLDLKGLRLGPKPTFVPVVSPVL